MMKWFQADAPIRLKLLVAFGSLTGLVFVATLAAAFCGGMIGVGIAVGATSFAALVGAWYRHAISFPYVSTVVRMEALAGGDLESPIAFTDYGDCVGRMTKAMFTFRDTAVAQRAHAQEQAEVVQHLSGKLQQLADGDLTAEVSAPFSGDYLPLKTNYNEALASLRELVGRVSQSAFQIRTGSAEIAQASEDLARRTEGNAASLEETSAALVQIDTRIKATAQAADRTVRRADQTISTVTGGRAIADEAVQAMGRVSESAKGIDNVIEGLDKIAFQTRVLAMNAAVEAGRAGEAGRGFAVVADLVSALAMRAEEEAKRARDQLTVTQTEIVSAVDAVQKVDGALADISGDVGEVHQLLGSMAADNQAQASAIGEISAAIGSMDQATQQNAAMVEQTSAAARNLTSEVETLADQAAQFRTGGDTARRSRKASPAAPAPRHFVPAKPRANGANGSYVSPVAALPSNGQAGDGFDDWKDF